MTISEDLERALSDPSVGLSEVIIDPGAREKLTETVQKLNPKARSLDLLMDETTYRLPSGGDAKQAAYASLSACFRVNKVVLPVPVHADEQVVSLVKKQATRGDSLVVIGSGTLSDLGKIAAHGRPYIMLQTAASVNGFADDESVLLKRGVKRTEPTSWITALLIDVDILQDSPPWMTVSGIGDLSSMFTANPDWLLANYLSQGDGWNRDIAMLGRNYGNQLLSLAPQIVNRDADAMGLLAHLLTISGLSMGLAHQTSPSSGMEHLISHMIDLWNGYHGTLGSPHGQQVGVSVIPVLYLWERMIKQILNKPSGKIRLPSDSEAQKMIHTAFDSVDPSGQASRECWRDYHVKLDRMRHSRIAEHIREVQKSWATREAEFRELLIPRELMYHAFSTLSAPVWYNQLPEAVNDDVVTWAYTYCFLMRKRFTIADLAFITGNWTPDIAAEFVRSCREKLVTPR